MCIKYATFRCAGHSRPGHHVVFFDMQRQKKVRMGAFFFFDGLVANEAKI